MAPLFALTANVRSSPTSPSILLQAMTTSPSDWERPGFRCIGVDGIVGSDMAKSPDDDNDDYGPARKCWECGQVRSLRLGTGDIAMRIPKYSARSQFHSTRRKDYCPRPTLNRQSSAARSKVNI